MDYGTELPRLATTKESSLMSYSSDYGGTSTGRPVNLRWVAALIIALFGIVTYFFETQTNPVTGEKQHVAMDVSQEMQLGLQAAPEMAAEMGGAADPARDPRARLVAEIGRRIVAQSDARRSPYVDN